MIFSFLIMNTKAQSFSSYYTGDTADITTSPIKGTVLMGGATENGNAMRWFLNRADGGDILVLRTTGSDGYNDYFYSDLGITVNSVQTIVCNSADASFDPYIVQQIENAEALWFAGGDQWDYVSYWRDTPVEDAINYVINEKKIPIGGTSAGCAIMGEAYFSAENGSATSSQSLNNPFNNFVTLGYDDFISNPATQNIITDTHYDNPDRRGRQVAFLARLYTEYGHAFYGIASEEYTAVCIDENNIASAYGSYPEEDDYVYFIQVNCFEPAYPEVCTEGEKLTWDRDNVALKVIKMGADDFGTNSVDLNDWKSISGSDYVWENWWVEDGDFQVAESSAIDCSVDIMQSQINQNSVFIYPNPAFDYCRIQISDLKDNMRYILYDINGNIIFQDAISSVETILPLKGMPPALYYLKIYSNTSCFVKTFEIIN